MSAMKTIQGVVTQVTVCKTNSAHPQVTLQVRNDTGAALVRISSSNPPLPGTEVSITGSVTPFSNGKGQFLSVSSDKDLVCVSGQQGVILRDIVSGLLNHLAISHDPSLVDPVLLNKNLDLAKVNETVMHNILTQLKVPDAQNIMDDYKAIFCENLVKGMLSGMERTRFPFVMDTKRTNPFKSGAWPQKIMKEFVPDFVTISLGQKAHPDMASNRKLYISDHLAHEGIDNFFRAISISTGINTVFTQWLASHQRDSVLTSAYLRDKQEEGIQMFSPEHLDRLKIFGIRNPEAAASRLGNMFRVNLDKSGSVLIPQGTYQSSSRIAMLDTIADKHFPLMDMNTGKPLVPDLHGLDVHQADAASKFCSGAPVMLLAGPPGTGKTTTLIRLIQMLQMSGESFMVLTPTGKAAARLNQGFATVNFPYGKPHASTIHGFFYSGQSAFGADRSRQMSFPVFSLRQALDGTAHEMFPVRADRIAANPSIMDKKNNVAIPKSMDALFHDLNGGKGAVGGLTLIVDESSQITGDMLALLLSTNPKRIIFAGDPWQLPPVGAGKPFQDLINLTLDAVPGQENSKLVLANLQIDHRATKDLALMTAEVRKGSLPADKAIVIDSTDKNSYTQAAKKILGEEFGLVETQEIKSALEMVRNIYKEEIVKTEPFFSLEDNETFNPGSVDASSSTLVFDRKMASALSCQKTVLPNMMTMAYTNEEVQSLATMIKSTMNTHRVAGHDLVHALPFSVLSSNDLMPGNIIMQTKNDKNLFEYQTPQGKRTHKGTMNGENYVFAGANVWLPLPGQAPSGSDIGVKLDYLWQKVKLHGDALNIAQGRLMADPDAHWALYSKLLHASPKKEAAALLRMALGEIILVDHSLLQDMKLNKGKYINVDEHPELVRRLAVLPNIPTKKAVGAIINDLGDYGLVQHFWAIATKATRATTGKADPVSQYNDLASATSTNLGQFTVGESCTVHKMQGSQCKIAITFVGPPLRPETSRQHEQACYTGITRSQEIAIVLAYGQTCVEINNMWDANRIVNKSIESPVQAIYRGDMAPLAETLTLTSVTLPGDSVFKGNKLFGVNLDNANIEFRKRTLLSSQGLPGDLDLTNVPLPLRNSLLNVTPNQIGCAPAHNYLLKWPDSGRIVDSLSDTVVLNKKAAYTKNVELNENNDFSDDLQPVHSLENDMQEIVKSPEEINNEMNDVFSNFF